MTRFWCVMMMIVVMMAAPMLEMPLIGLHAPHLIIYPAAAWWRFVS